jgi:hypothetical protein
MDESAKRRGPEVLEYGRPAARAVGESGADRLARGICLAAGAGSAFWGSLAMAFTKRLYGDEGIACVIVLVCAGAILLLWMYVRFAVRERRMQLLEPADEPPDGNSPSAALDYATRQVEPSPHAALHGVIGVVCGVVGIPIGLIALVGMALSGGRGGSSVFLLCMVLLLLGWAITWMGGILFRLAR